MKLPILKTNYIPRFEFEDPSGKIIRNRELPADEQIRVQIRYANAGQNKRYMRVNVVTDADVKNSEQMKFVTDYDYETALSKHVVKIENLFDAEGNEIKDGHDLIKSGNPILNELCDELFARITGNILDDEDRRDGVGEFTEGEGRPSP